MSVKNDNLVSYNTHHNHMLFTYIRFNSHVLRTFCFREHGPWWIAANVGWFILGYYPSTRKFILYYRVFEVYSPIHCKFLSGFLYLCPLFILWKRLSDSLIYYIVRLKIWSCTVLNCTTFKKVHFWPSKHVSCCYYTEHVKSKGRRFSRKLLLLSILYYEKLSILDAPSPTK